MPAFTVTGRNDQTCTVWSRDAAWLIGSLKGAYFQAYKVITDLAPHEYDFIMPKDVQALHDRLREMAGIPRLCDVQRGKEYSHEKYGTVTLIASDPDDGAYLICKYWDTELDAQAYFGCEADDLRFVEK